MILNNPCSAVGFFIFLQLQCCIDTEGVADFICCIVVTSDPEDRVCELEVVREKDICFKLRFTCRQCFRASELTERGL